MQGVSMTSVRIRWRDGVSFYSRVPELQAGLVIISSDGEDGEEDDGGTIITVQHACGTHHGVLLL